MSDLLEELERRRSPVQPERGRVGPRSRIDDVAAAVAALPTAVGVPRVVAADPGQLHRERDEHVVQGPRDDNVVVERYVPRYQDAAVPDTWKSKEKGIN